MKKGDLLKYGLVAVAVLVFADKLRSLPLVSKLPTL